MNCRCKTKMELIYSNHYDSYIDIYWCPKCGCLYKTDEDDEEDRIPDDLKGVY